MTILRVKPAEWGIGDKLTSAEINAVDENATHALDKRAGQTDTLASLITLGGAGRMVQAAATAPDANQTYQIDGGNLTVLVPGTLTASRTYTLSNTNAVDGDHIQFFFDPAALGAYNVLIKDAGANTIATLGPSGDSYWGEFVFAGSTWKAKISSIGWRLQTALFTTPGAGSWNCPLGVSFVLVMLVGSGGGGGGGGGRTGTNGGGGGGGGGGGKMTISLATVTGGASISYNVGSGGGLASGGGETAAGGDGGDGQKSWFVSSTTHFANGGQRGVGGLAGASGNSYARGGFPANPAGVVPYGNADPYPPPIPGQGGWGRRFPSGAPVFFSSSEPFYGGSTSAATGGTPGTTNSAGGGGGGGGGASEWPGGNGGAGGAGSNGATQQAGFDGAIGTLGSGGGGGGGGNGAAGGVGGASYGGGSGAIRLIWIR